MFWDRPQTKAVDRTAGGEHHDRNFDLLVFLPNI